MHQNSRAGEACQAGALCSCFWPRFCSQITKHQKWEWKLHHQTWDTSWILLGNNMGVSKNRGTPKSSHFNRIFHYKPSILGYHYFWKHPYRYTYWYQSSISWVGFSPQPTLLAAELLVGLSVLAFGMRQSFSDKMASEAGVLSWEPKGIPQPMPRLLPQEIRPC